MIRRKTAITPRAKPGPKKRPTNRVERAVKRMRGQGDPDVSQCSGGFIARLFGVSGAAVSQWDECPKNDNGTYDLFATMGWWMDNRAGDKAELEKEKLRVQIKKMEYELETMQQNTIPREDSRAIFCKRAEELKAYFMDSGLMNLHLMASKPIEPLRVMWKDFVRKAFNNWAEKHP